MRRDVIYQGKTYNAQQIAGILNVARSTVCRWINKKGQDVTQLAELRIKRKTQGKGPRYSNSFSSEELEFAVQFFGAVLSGRDVRMLARNQNCGHLLRKFQAMEVRAQKRAAAS